MSARASAPPALSPPDTPWFGLRRLADALAALLCLWAAGYHTPVGALLRLSLAHVLGARSAARPILSYYSEGLYRTPRDSAAPRPLPPRLPPAVVSPSLAPGWGAFVALSQLDPEERARVLARQGGLAAPLDSRAGAPQLSSFLARRARELGSPDLAAIALFCGEDAARYALHAGGPGADFEELARKLSPRLCPHLDLAGQALALGTAAGLAWPLPETARITSPFGMRDHPLLEGRRLHKGVDLGVPEGTPVRATAAGLVRRVSSDFVNGNLVVVDHGHGVTTSYLHNDELLCAPGARVARGEVIALSGNSGRSTGPHLHYQLELSGTPIDPLRLRSGSAMLSSPGATEW
jgi:murein DD-endopeptidase